jgi:hypothetical protein
MSPLATKARLRHHVGDGAKCHQMQQRQQVGLGARRVPEIPLPQFARQRDQRDEYKPDRGKMAQAGKIVGAVGIDDGYRRRQFLIGLVVIDHNRIEAELLGFR